MNWNKQNTVRFVWLIVIGLMSFHISLAQDADILFEDDFEGGASRQWTYWLARHEVVEMAGNQVFHLENRADNWASVEIILPNDRQNNWTHYAFEAQIQFVAVDRTLATPQFALSIRNSVIEDKRNGYAGWLTFGQRTSGGSVVGWVDGKISGIAAVEQNMIGPEMNTWHTLRLQANANEITFSLDGRIISRVLHDAVKRGGVALEFSPGTEFYLDDVRIIQLEAQEPILDTRYADVDCTIPEPGVFGNASASVFTFNMPSGVNVRSLAADNFGSVISLPQTTNVGVLGWFDASGTPLESIADGTWLVLYDGNYAVKASLVSIAETALIDVPQYQYIDGTLIPPEVDEPEEDTSNRFEVTYADFCKGSFTWTTQTVAINPNTMMPVPFGLIEPGVYPSIDEANSYSGVLSGIFVRSWEVATIEGMRNLIIAFPTEEDTWETVYISASNGFSLHPVNNELDLLNPNPAGQVFVVQPGTRIATNAIYAERTIHPGDHVILFFGEFTTNREGVQNTQKGCNDFATTSEAIAFLIEGGTCKQVYNPTEAGWVGTYLRGVMFLNN